MSLKIEQRLDNHTFTESKPRIYTTGAYLVPMQIISNGRKRFVWVAAEFENNTYNDKGLSVSPNVYADDVTRLFDEQEFE